jgi:hypothetical protein
VSAASASRAAACQLLLSLDEQGVKFPEGPAVAPAVTPAAPEEGAKGASAQGESVTESHHKE